MNKTQQEKRLNEGKESSGPLRIAIAGLQEIQELSWHQNSDPRIRDLVSDILGDIANNFPQNKHKTKTQNHAN